MAPRLLKPPRLNIPKTPLAPLRKVIQDSRQYITKAEADIRSLADEMKVFSLTGKQAGSRAPESQEEGLLPATVTETSTEEKAAADIATACVPCAIGHYAGAARLLNEAIRFRDDGIESNQVLDDIAGAIGELNAMERVDLTPERLQRTPAWERAIADETLRESRKLRHRLEGIGSMEEIEKAAADTESYYKKLNRQWYRGRFRNLGAKKAEAIAQRVGEK